MRGIFRISGDSMIVMVNRKPLARCAMNLFSVRVQTKVLN